MARHWFGRSHAGWVMTRGEEVVEEEVSLGYQPLLQPEVTVTLWDAQEGGSQLTDLLDADGLPVTEVESDADGNIPRFQGPDDVAYLWASASGDGSEPRYIMSSTNLGDTIATLESQAGDTWMFSAPGVETGAAYRKYNDHGRSLDFQWLRATAGVQPDGGDVTVDVLLNGATSIFTAAPTIADGTSTTGKITTFDTEQIADGEYVTIDLSGNEAAEAIVVELRVS